VKLLAKPTIEGGTLVKSDPAQASKDFVSHLPILLAAASIAPASIYLDNQITNPSIARLLELVACFFALITLVTGTLFYFWRSNTVFVSVAFAWVVFSVSGLLLNRTESELLRTGFLATLLLAGYLLLRIFPNRTVRWFRIASVLSIAATVLQLGLSAIAQPAAASTAPVIATGVQSSIYLIVVDGYGALPQDLAAFSDQLRAEGVVVIDGALTNYSITHTALSNTLSLEHRFKSNPDLTREAFAAMQGASQMRAILERRGWEYLHFESDWTGTRCGPTVTKCVGKRFGNGLLWDVAQMSYIAPYVEANVPHPHITHGLHTLDLLRGHASSAAPTNEFVFAHILIPHPPLQLRANCDIEIDPRLQGQQYLLQDTTQAMAALRWERYLEQLTCLNSKLLALIESLPHEASLIITGDHGPDLHGQLDKAPLAWNEADIAQRFRIFHASRLPARCELTESRDLVNLVRSEVSCITGDALPAIAPYFEISPALWSTDTARVLPAIDLLG
jgi:hypothetical protein